MIDIFFVNSCKIFFSPPCKIDVNPKNPYDMTDFEKYASKDRSISSMTLHRYGNVVDAYINPSIIEERKLNIAAMDVFSRLMMDRIIFRGSLS